MIHRITFRAFVAATEDGGRVKEALSIFVPLDGIETTEVSGHFGNEIKILQATLKRRDGRAFFEILREQLSEADRRRLLSAVSQRVDEGGRLHLRLDKQAAYKGFVALTDSRDAIDVSAHIATYPASYEEAVRIAGELLAGEPS